MRGRGRGKGEREREREGGRRGVTLDYLMQTGKVVVTFST